MADKVTIFVHGTLFPLLRQLVQAFDCPLGLIPADTRPNRYLLSRIPYIISEAAPQNYPLSSFYLFGWSGKLRVQARIKAAEDLYLKIRDLKGSLTIIGHSHGATVALLLAYIAQKYNDKNFKVDKLILLACPVQEATALYSTYPVFKKIFSLYSSTDLVQIADPQGLYTPHTLSFFSRRTFNPAPQLIQARVLINGHNPYHITFMLQRFLKKLPAVIALLEKIKNTQKLYTVNIPTSEEKPSMVE